MTSSHVKSLSLYFFRVFLKGMTKTFERSSSEKKEINTYFICAILLVYSNYLICIHGAIKVQSRTYKVY